MGKLTLWSYRFSTAYGYHWKNEREVNNETAKSWLEIFQKDESEVKFQVSTKKPKNLEKA